MSERDLPIGMRKMLPSYSDKMYYLFQVSRMMNEVVEAEFKKLHPDDSNFYFSHPIESIAKAIAQKGKYSRVAKRGFRKATIHKDIALLIYDKMKSDLGGFDGYEKFIQTYYDS